MKVVYNIEKQVYEVKKGKINIEIIPGQDRPWRPVKIKYENCIYDVKHEYNSLIKISNAFGDTYSEEQVLEVLMDIVKL